MGNKRDSGTAEKKSRFLDELRKRYSVYHAARAAGIGRTTAYRWRGEDEDFARAWDEALEDAIDTLEASVYERALHGVEEPVYYGGEEVGTVRRYSDTLAIFLLKGAKPDKYRERSTTELTGPGGGPIRVVFVPPGSDQQ